MRERVVLQGLFSRENFRSGTLRARLRKFAFGRKSAPVLTLGCRHQGSAPWLPTFTAPAFAGTPAEPRRGDSPYRPCSTRGGGLEGTPSRPQRVVSAATGDRGLVLRAYTDEYSAYR
jgi:hypothetical protein